MAKQILFDEKARESMKKGMDKLAAAVKMTLGPRGRAAVLEKGYGAPQVTFDGVTVAKEIELEDKYENLGAEFLKQAADKTNDKVGDGTTTAVVLAHAMIEEGDRLIKSKGFNVIRLSEALKEFSKPVEEELKKQSQPITDERIAEVATLSSKDEEIGKLIAGVIKKVGKEGVVTIEDSNTIENSHEIVEGMQFDRGYISSYMVTNADKMESDLEDPLILVTDKKISSVGEIVPLLEKIVKSGKKELVIIADEVEGEALATLVLNKLRGIFTVLAVKAPGFGDRKKEMLQDICVVTGAQLISEDVGKKLENTEISELGQAHRVVADKDKTTIIDGKGEKKEIEKRVSQIKNQLQKTESEFDKEKLQERLGKLSGGVAVIKVGAPTESAQKGLKQRVEDAVAATKAAMEEGIVPGGGMALFNLREMSVDEKQEYDKDVINAAMSILRKALISPVEAIIENSGASVHEVMKELEEKKDPWVGFNALKNKISNLKEDGVIDPLKVTRTAFTNAVSVASNYLTIGAAVVDIPEKEEKSGGGPGHGHEEY
ncbi:MAG: 60 kDa chaperonin [Candidatus Wolfebacteria bacterium GW2011_GWC1_43_10]|uniref:60 kDa chaperonin n=1 Tax=Candidatus Wolfebacteria bacterium GW2011_GWC1_43_10 TaxID=1619011 RepID=A0A0G1CB00_9BACT|nr:MAG: 60 kDa chaperonin [Candidatus Wolfebacteria bacterium GW2011_GWC1_43_10]KKT22922.1 MAG: 60 kDa chaperonin [Parcubacteria group bacterium GW2011_GWB1_43_8b]